MESAAGQSRHLGTRPSGAKPGTQISVSIVARVRFAKSVPVLMMEKPEEGKRTLGERDDTVTVYRRD